MEAGSLRLQLWRRVACEAATQQGKGRFGRRCRYYSAAGGGELVPKCTHRVLELPPSLALACALACGALGCVFKATCFQGFASYNAIGARSIGAVDVAPGLLRLLASCRQHLAVCERYGGRIRRARRQRGAAQASRVGCGGWLFDVRAAAVRRHRRLRREP